MNRILILLFLSAALLYGWVSSLSTIGMFNDDSLFVCMAQSLLDGHYRALFSPLLEPVKTPLPGYPLLILPTVLLFGSTSVFLKIQSIFFVLLSAGFLFGLLKNEGHSNKTILLTLSFYVFNATLIPFSSIVMSEPSFLAFSMGAVYLLSRKERTALILSGVLLGWAWLIRPQGIFLIASVLFVLARQKNYRNATWVGGVALGFYGLIYGLVSFSAADSKSYSDLLLANLSTRLNPVLYVQNLKSVLGLAFPGLFFQMPGHLSGWFRSVVAWACVGVAVWFIFLRLLRSKKNLFVTISVLFVLQNVFFLPLWFGMDMRYVMLIFPFLVFLIIPAIIESVGRKLNKIGVLIIFALLFLPHGLRTWTVVANASLARSHQYKPLQYESFEWIKTNTDSSDYFLSVSAPTLYLYTDRKSLSYFDSDDQASFLKKLENYEIRYVFLDSKPMVETPDNSKIKILVRNVWKWVSESGETFSLVYENPGEGVLIYKVL